MHRLLIYLSHLGIKFWAWTVLVAFYSSALFYTINLLRKRFNAAAPVEQKESAKQKLSKLRNAVVFAIAVVGLLWIAGHAQEVLNWLVKEFGKRWVQVVGATIAVGLGWLGHFFKGRRQWEYGLVEVGFGGVATMVALAHMDQQNFVNTLATLAGCVYVVVRGFNNMGDGYASKEKREKEQRQREWLKLWRRQQEYLRGKP
jgi:hypothetical protein